MFERYAVFFTPTGPLAEWGASWLGWDSAAGVTRAHPAVAGIDVAHLTETPRKYGLHGTLKAPFRLARIATEAQVHAAAATFATRHAPCTLGAMDLRHDSGFIALRPARAPESLTNLAAATVRAFDRFRAPLTAADIARRRAAPLTPRQDQQMLDFGYPYIFDDFHFHLTLTGRLPADAAQTVMAVLAPQVSPLIAQPCVVDAITLMGQDGAGMFHQLHRYTLTG